MPRLVIGLGCICAVVILLKAWMNLNTGEKGKEIDRKQVVVGVAVFLFITLLMVFAKHIGMYVSTYLSILAISLTICYFEHGLNRKAFIKAALFDLIVLAITFLLFSIVLKVNSPKGFLI